MSARADLEAALQEVVGKGLRQDAFYPVVAPRTAEETAQVVRLARDYQFSVLVLGNESSKPPQLTGLRENILVILNVWLTGIQKLSPFAARVMSGTPVSSVIRDGSEPPRKTLGGLICGTPGAHHDASLRALWPRVRYVEIITAGGDLQRFAAPGAASTDDPAMANLLLGSRGRLGVITAVEVTTPLPIPVTDSSERATLGAAVGEPLLSQKDVQSLLDPHGLFQW
jgi:FAD/FMN-containing dehydrogenase